MKIISFEQFVENKIPNLDDFGKASDLFLETILSKNKKNIKGVLRHGNVINPRVSSDIDFLILTTDLSSDEHIRSATLDVFKEHSVPIEPRIISDFQVKNELYTLNSSYLLALEKGEVLFGKNPLLGINFNESIQNSSLQSIRHNYLKLKNNYAEAIPTHVMAESILNKVKHTMVNTVKFKFNEHIQDELELTEKYFEVVSDDKSMRDVLQFKQFRSMYDQILIERRDSESGLSNRVKSDYHYVTTAIVAKYCQAVNLIETTLDAITRK
jgi:hypothetical protein